MKKNSMIILKRVLISAIILLCASLIGIGLLCGVYLLPVDRMNVHVSKDIDIIVNEGDYPAFGEGVFVRMHPYNINFETFFLNNRGMARDNFTDAIMLGNAISNPQEKPLLDRALQVYRGDAVECQPIQSLKVQLENENDSVMTSYPRYWHGYLVILKPLLLIFTYTQIRYLNAFLQVVLLTMLLYMMGKKLGKEYAMAMGIATLFMFPFIIPLCMQYSTMVYIVLISSNILLWKIEYWRCNQRYAYFFLLEGISTCYFDFLTYPIVSLGIPLILLISDYTQEQRNNVKCVLDSCFMWGIGYGGIWSLKWILATWLGSTDVIKDALEQAFYRISGNTDTQASGVNAIEAILANFSCFTNIIFIILILITFILMACQVKKNGITVLNLIKKQWTCLTIAALPFIWYGVLKNHSFDHSSFTYRAMWVSVFGVWTAILNMCRAKSSD